MTLLPPAVVPPTVSVSANPVYGAQGTPHYITNAYYQPEGYFGTANSVTTTINRCYYIPFSVWESHTFQGAATFNSGAGDNTETLRMMMFNDNGVGGGPGTLAVDFGQITLSAASAQRTLATPWSAAAGMYWAAIWHSSVAAMYSMEQQIYVSNAGAIAGMQPSMFMGTLTYSAASSLSSLAHYVDTAYGAAPATAVAPTASITSNLGAGLVPLFSLKA